MLQKKEHILPSDCAINRLSSPEELGDCFGVYIMNANLANVTDFVTFLDIVIVCISGLVSSVRRTHASKLKGPGFKSQPGTVGDPFTIIMLDALPG